MASDPAYPNFKITPDRIIQSRRLRPCKAIFAGFGFQTQLSAYTNSIELRGTYAQAEQAGGFTYVTPNVTGTTPIALPPRL